MKYLFRIIIILITIISFSCSQKKENLAQIMFMSGDISEATNHLNIELQKGDTIVLRIHCGDFNPCKQSIIGFYKGKLLDRDVRMDEKGQFKESFHYEKAIFLRSLK